MIDVAAVRAAVAAVVRPSLTAAARGQVPVYEVVPDGSPAWPAVVLGMPSWRPGPTGCFDEYGLPVAVVVDNNGTSIEGAQRELDLLWPVVLDGLQRAIAADQTLGGAVVEVHVTSAEYGTFAVGGAGMPAQNITLTLHG